ncbi:MAG: N-acetyl-gamma-glutamyl-phosphate reductase [Candidatus Promineifilaceae bacterium]|nr:N-acetyl-gamma-glutamyl-phosphate reductase [Candidatus Promineifilaceae bacterium]
MSVRVSVAGASGYVGGELLRLLLGHPEIEIGQVTSERYAGRYVHGVHPNLRGRSLLRFSPLAELEACDVLFLALPHGETAEQVERFGDTAERVVDLSADFRLRDAEAYERWYGRPHPRPEWLERFVYGLPELHRRELAGARYASGVGCNATAVNLALWPLAERGLVERAVVEVKVGSSEGGAGHSLATHHPERSGCVRSFAPTGHRHQAEMTQALGDVELHFSATAVEMVRGVLCTAHVFLARPLEERDVWRAYREAYGDEPFIRLVKERRGVYRYPEPKILAGTNFCDVGFEKDPHAERLVVISALDNLMKGAAGTAVQALNVMMGWPEEAGLTFPGLHPI